MGVTLYCGFKSSGSKAESVAIPNKCLLFLLLLRGLVLLRREFGEALGRPWFSCSESVGSVFCSHTWSCSPRSEDAILPLQQWPLVSLNQRPSCQKGLRSAQLVSSRWMSWTIQIRAWEPAWFGKRPFCPPQENLTLQCEEERGWNLGNPRNAAAKQKELCFLDCAALQTLLHSKGLHIQRWKHKPSKAGAPQGDSPTEDFTLTSVSMQQRLWKPRMEGNWRSPNPTLCLMGESLFPTQSHGSVIISCSLNTFQDKELTSSKWQGWQRTLCGGLTVSRLAISP